MFHALMSACSRQSDYANHTFCSVCCCMQSGPHQAQAMLHALSCEQARQCMQDVQQGNIYLVPAAGLLSLFNTSPPNLPRFTKLALCFSQLPHIFSSHSSIKPANLSVALPVRQQHHTILLVRRQTFQIGLRTGQLQVHIGAKHRTATNNRHGSTDLGPISRPPNFLLSRTFKAFRRFSSAFCRSPVFK